MVIYACFQSGEVGFHLKPILGGVAEPPEVLFDLGKLGMMMDPHASAGIEMLLPELVQIGPSSEDAEVHELAAVIELLIGNDRVIWKESSGDGPQQWRRS